MSAESNPPIINCHTHIFKGEHVPPYLAKTFVPWPLSKFISIPRVLWIFRKFVNKKNKEFKDPQIEENRDKTIRKIKNQRNVLRTAFITLLKAIVNIHMLFIVLAWLGINSNLSRYAFGKYVFAIHQWLLEHYLMLPIKNLLVQIAVVIFTVTFIKSGRNLFLFLGKKFLSFPGKMTRELIDRYLLLGRFTIYKDQSTTFSKLVHQYPPQTKFIVLPMDMEYMDAGELQKGSKYPDQMAELAKIKSQSTNKDAILPFVFVEPRRIKGDKKQLNYSFNKRTGEVKLEDCFIKEYIEEKEFSGFKIYPALGYYPFDEALLPLWKYAADKEIPIMTHCIKGTIFYRGTKKKEWNQHPIFKEYINLERKELGPLLLPQKKNLDFSINFTHPLNYLVLLKEELLRLWVGKGSITTQELFGYTNDETPLKRDLSHLKICLAHFGGEDQWERYLESDRYNYAAQLKINPKTGINFIYTNEGDFSWKKLEDCWKYVDWYSIICSMILQHTNVYADISYILHDKAIFDLLKETIDHPGLGEKVLFGTDFFVVRNHMAEKNLLVQTKGNLSDEQFKKIAQRNPNKYL